MIVARPDTQLGDQVFRVRLDAEVPFKLADPADQTASDQRQADIGHGPG
jgi:hypothetical protein